MILHTINAMPDTAAFQDCLEIAGADDAILLMGDACYALLPNSQAAEKLALCSAQKYFVDTDAAARGLSGNSGKASSVDMDGFVELTEAFSKQQAWY
jgi:tRNA 2-thiouridine synthesizing protein B